MRRTDERRNSSREEKRQAPHGDLATGAFLDRIEIAYGKAPDFPAIDPNLAGHPYEDFWLLGISKTGQPSRKTFDQVVHASWSHPDRVDFWNAPPGHYLSNLVPVHK